MKKKRRKWCKNYCKCSLKNPLTNFLKKTLEWLFMDFLEKILYKSLIITTGIIIGKSKSKASREILTIFLVEILDGSGFADRASRSAWCSDKPWQVLRNRVSLVAIYCLNFHSRSLGCSIDLCSWKFRGSFISISTYDVYDVIMDDVVMDFYTRCRNVDYYRTFNHVSRKMFSITAKIF